MLLAAKTYSQEIEGRYSVGKTACTIERGTGTRVYKAYWDAGTG